jgi:hypothetical protein
MVALKQVLGIMARELRRGGIGRGGLGRQLHFCLRLRSLHLEMPIPETDPIPTYLSFLTSVWVLSFLDCLPTGNGALIRGPQFSKQQRLRLWVGRRSEKGRLIAVGKRRHIFGMIEVVRRPRLHPKEIPDCFINRQCQKVCCLNIWES